MIQGTRVTTESWHEVLEDFVDDENLIVRRKNRSSR